MIYFIFLFQTIVKHILLLCTPKGIDAALLPGFQHKQTGGGWHHLLRWETLRKEQEGLELGKYGGENMTGQSSAY